MVDVSDGRVTLSGAVERRSLTLATVRLCENVDGVVDLVDPLTYAWDDTVHKSADPVAKGGGHHV